MEAHSASVWDVSYILVTLINISFIYCRSAFRTLVLNSIPCLVFRSIRVLRNNFYNCFNNLINIYIFFFL